MPLTKTSNYEDLKKYFKICEEKNINSKKISISLNQIFKIKKSSKNTSKFII